MASIKFSVVMHTLDSNVRYTNLFSTQYFIGVVLSTSKLIKTLSTKQLISTGESTIVYCTQGSVA